MVTKEEKLSSDIPMLHPRKLTGCGVCGSRLVFIRGRYPQEKKRKICPTCAYEKLEQIHEITDQERDKACTAKTRLT